MNAEVSAQPLVVFGSGGLARRIPSILDDLRAAGFNYELLGFLDTRNEGEPGDSGVIGGDEKIADIDAEFIVAIGDPTTRQRLDKHASRYHRSSATVIHPRAYLESPATISAGCVILAGAAVQAHATLARHVLVGNYAVIGHDVRVGPYTTVSPGSVISGATVVGARVHIGVGAIVLPGREIGDDAVIGAGAVVSHDVLPGTTVVGMPARAR